MPIEQGPGKDLNDEPQSTGNRRTAWIAGAAIAVVAVTAVVLYAVSDKPSPSKDEDPQVGLACGPLRAATSALASGQEGDLVASLKEAEKAALQSLDETGKKFGRPERMALEAASEDLSRPLNPKTLDRIRARLTVADEVCEAKR